MTRKVKVGFIGAGAVGQMHIKHWSQLPNCEIVALADLRPELLAKVATKHNIPLRYNSHADLIQNPEIEATVIVTRRHNTSAVVFDCLKSGKHVFSEKPMAKTLEQAERLVTIANKQNRIYTIGYQRRHDAGTQIAKQKFDELLHTKELGEIVQIYSWNFTGQDRLFAEDSIMTQEERPSGVQWHQTPQWIPERFHHAYDRFINVSSHDVSILRYFTGQTPKVRFADLGQKNSWVVIFDFNDFLSTFIGSLNELNTWEERSEWDEGLEIFFEKGRLRVQFSPPLIHHLCSKVEFKRGKHDTEILCNGTNQPAAFELQASHFINDVIREQVSIASGKDALEDLKMTEDIWRNYLTSTGVLSLDY